MTALRSISAEKQVPGQRENEVDHVFGGKIGPLKGRQSRRPGHRRERE